jgi:tRNA (guanine37-N1)-methyltransferase
MRFDVLTIFPELINTVINESITGRAINNGIIEVNAVNIRDFSTNKHKKVDDYPYGGGSGMVMMPQPIMDAYKAILSSKVSNINIPENQINEDFKNQNFKNQNLTNNEKPYTIYMSPQGNVLTQKKACELFDKEHIIILCGHYEGIDERIIEEIIDEEISIGDYVLTGGELPALVLIDCISRMVPGVLSSEEAFSEESHFNGLLEYPQYTRPYDYNGKTVPDILLSGHHENIAIWRKKQALERTAIKRPDLLKLKKL